MRRKSPRFTWICGAVALCLAVVFIGSASPSFAAPARCKPGSASKTKKKPEKQPRGREKENGKEKPAEAAPASEAPADAPKGGESEESRAIQRGERVEFDARLIQGQTAKAGAVYLFARVSTNLRSMVKERSSFRDKIIRSVFPTTETAPPPPAVVEAPKEEVAP